jgi:chromosomal replication initiation ATPase DnaA
MVSVPGGSDSHAASSRAHEPGQTGACLDQIIRTTCKELGIDESSLRGRRRPRAVSRARRAVAYAAVRAAGISLRHVATALGVAPSAVTRMLLATKSEK